MVLQGWPRRDFVYRNCVFLVSAHLKMCYGTPHGTPTGEPGSSRPVLSDFQGSGRLPFMSCHCCPFAQQRRLHLAEKSSVETHKIDLVVQSLLGGPICGRLQRMVACSWKKVKSLSNLKLLGVRGTPTASK